MFETVKISWPSVSVPVGQPHLQSVPSGLICFQLRTEIVECCSQSCLLGILGFGLGLEYVLFLAAAKGLEQPKIVIGCRQKGYVQHFAILLAHNYSTETTHTANTKQASRTNGRRSQFIPGSAAEQATCRSWSRSLGFFWTCKTGNIKLGTLEVTPYRPRVFS